jgi:hypothetical protein
VTVALLVMTDGRRACIARTIPTALEQLDGPISFRVIHDDSGDPDYREWLAEQFPSFTIIGATERRGFAAALQVAWKFCSTLEADFIFHLEDDFLLRRPVDLGAMATVLHDHPHLLQLALLRQAVNESELRAGGIIEQDPSSYEIVRDGDQQWVEHRICFTTNPSLYRRSLCARGWPDGSESEGKFSAVLFAEGKELRCAYWGEGEACQHIGERSGIGY